MVEIDLNFNLNPNPDPDPPPGKIFGIFNKDVMRYNCEISTIS